MRQTPRENLTTLGEMADRVFDRACWEALADPAIVYSWQCSPIVYLEDARLWLASNVGVNP